MYTAVVIILFIISIELYPLIIKRKENNKINISEITKEIKNETIFLPYKEHNTFEKDLKPGKIYTKDDYNLFIIKEKEVFLVKPNKIYELKGDFKLRYLKIRNDEVLEYYYG